MTVDLSRVRELAGSALVLSTDLEEAGLLSFADVAANLSMMLTDYARRAEREGTTDDQAD